MENSPEEEKKKGAKVYPFSSWATRRDFAGRTNTQLCANYNTIISEFELRAKLVTRRNSGGGVKKLFEGLVRSHGCVGNGRRKWKKRVTLRVGIQF